VTKVTSADEAATLKRTPWPAGEASLGQARQLRLSAGAGQYVLNPHDWIDTAARQDGSGEVGGNHQSLDEGDHALGFRWQLAPPPVRLQHPGIDALTRAIREVYFIVRHDWRRRHEIAVQDQSGSA
jgi:hypothetical protein